MVFEKVNYMEQSGRVRSGGHRHGLAGLGRVCTGELRYGFFDKVKYKIKVFKEGIGVYGKG